MTSRPRPGGWSWVENKQLDEGAGRQRIWKYLDLLNCVAPAAFGKHGTWVQARIWHFQGTCISQLEPSTSVANGIAWFSDYSSLDGYNLCIFNILRKLKGKT